METKTLTEADQLRVKNRRKRIRYGYIMGIFTAILWGMWYIPGNLMWVIEPFTNMYDAVAVTHGDMMAMIAVAVLISAANALMGAIMLTIWNGSLRKLREMKRTIVEFKNVTRYLILGSVCAGPIAIFGSYLATGFIGASFAAVACLGYPVVGTILSSSWLGQKISKRAIIGIAVIICGVISIYAGGLVTEIMSGEVRILGYIGGLMAIIGWGLEGAVAAKAMEVAQPDVMFQIRVFSETGLWWIVIIPIFIIAGFPFMEYIIPLFTNPVSLLVIAVSGLTFGFCNLTWYKSFALIGVGRGQGLACLNALFALVFIFIFTGVIPAWTIVLGGVISVIGLLIMFSEDDSNLETLKGSQEAAE